MPVGNITKDLSEQVGRVNAISDALKHLQGVASSLFGTLGNLSETFGTQIGRAANTAAGAGGKNEFLTARGSQAKAQFLHEFSERSEQGFAEAVLAGKVSEVQEISGRKFFHVEGGLKIGSHLQERFPHSREGRVSMYRSLADNIANAHGIIGGVSDHPEPAITKKRGPRPGIGYDITDLAATAQQAQGFQLGGSDRNQLGRLMQQLEGKNDSVSNALATQLRGVREALDGNIQALHNASAQYAESVKQYGEGSNEAAEASTKLTDAIGTLSKNMDTFKVINKTGGGGGGGGENEPFMSPERGRRYAAAAGAGLGVLATGAQVYMQAALGMDRAVYGGEVRAAQATGSLAAREFGMTTEAHDMTNPENLLRYRANLLMPGRRFDYIGTEGIKNSMQVGSQMARLNLDIMSQERRAGVVGAAFQGLQGLANLGIGAAMVSGSGGTGAAMGGAMAVQGATQAMGAVSSGVSAYTGSPITALNGGLNEGLTGFIGRMRHGAQWKGLSEFAQKAVAAQTIDSAFQTGRELQDAELRRMGPQMMAMNEIQDMIGAQKEGAVLVGEYAARRNNLIGKYIAPNGRMYADQAAGQRDQDLAVASAASKGGDFRAGMTVSAIKGRDQIQKEQDQALKASKAYREMRQLEGRKYDSDIAEHGLASPEGARAARQLAVLDNRVNRAEAIVKKNRELLWPGATSSMSEIESEYMKANERAQAAVDKTQGYSTDSFKRAISKNESSGSYDVWNKTGTSDAYGKYQMIGATRRSMAGRMGIAEADFHLNGVAAHDAKARDYQERAMSLLAGDYKRDVAGLRGDPSLKFASQFSDFQLMAMEHHRGANTLRQILRTGNDPYAKAGRDIHTFDYARLAAQRAGMSVSPYAPGYQPPGTADAGAGPTPQTVFSRLEMGAADFMRHQNQLTNFLGSAGMGGGRGLEAGVEQTARMVTLGRSGLGSFEQQLQSLGTLNRVSGGQDNTRLLERVLSEAVAAGFDKSRVAQTFVQRTAEVMQAANATGAVSGTLLGRTAIAMGGGMADERNMLEAAKGINDLSRYTGQVNGIPGAVKLMSGAGTGATIQSGLGLLARTNMVEQRDMIDQLSGGANMTTRTRAFMEAQGGKEQATNTLRKNMAAQSTMLSGILKFAGFDADASLKAAKGANGATSRSAMLEKGMRQAYTVGAALDIGSEGAAAAYMSMAEQQGLVNPADARSLERKMKTGTDVFVDPAKQQLRAFIDKNIADFAVSTKGAGEMGSKGSQSLYRQYLEGGGAAYSVSADAVKGMSEAGKAQVGKAITQEAYDNGSAEFRRAADATLKDVSKFDLVRGAEMGIQQMEGSVQAVKITNFGDIFPYLVTARVVNPNDLRKKER